MEMAVNVEVKEESKAVVTIKQSLPSPSSTIESLTREFEHSLDIHSAIKGQYVVKPQVSRSSDYSRKLLTNYSPLLF